MHRITGNYSFKSKNRFQHFDLWLSEVKAVKKLSNCESVILNNIYISKTCQGEVRNGREINRQIQVQSVT